MSPQRKSFAYQPTNLPYPYSRLLRGYRLVIIAPAHRAYTHYQIKRNATFDRRHLIDAYGGLRDVRDIIVSTSIVFDFLVRLRDARDFRVKP